MSFINGCMGSRTPIFQSKHFYILISVIFSFAKMSPSLSEYI